MSIPFTRSYLYIGVMTLIMSQDMYVYMQTFIISGHRFRHNDDLIIIPPEGPFHIYPLPLPDNNTFYLLTLSLCFFVIQRTTSLKFIFRPSVSHLSRVP